MARAARAGDRKIAINRKARRDYFIEQTLEAGIMLVGSEVKSLRNGQASVAESHAAEKDGELFLLNAHIPEYGPANRFNHDPRRPRKLLVHRRELRRLIGTVQRSGMTLVPLSIYFNERGRAKVEIGIARGKRQHDKRASEKNRDWQRQKQRLMRDRL